MEENEKTLNITWQEPTQPNGFIIEYVILRDGVEIYRSFYNDDGYEPLFMKGFPFLTHNNLRKYIVILNSLRISVSQILLWGVSLFKTSK